MYVLAVLKTYEWFPEWLQCNNQCNNEESAFHSLKTTNIFIYIAYLDQLMLKPLTGRTQSHWLPSKSWANQIMTNILNQYGNTFIFMQQFVKDHRVFVKNYAWQVVFNDIACLGIDPMLAQVSTISKLSRLWSTYEVTKGIYIKLLSLTVFHHSSKLLCKLYHCSCWQVSLTVHFICCILDQQSQLELLQLWNVYLYMCLFWK